MAKNSLEKDLKWYTENRPTFEKFTQKIKGMMTEILEAGNIDVYGIQARTKSQDSFKSKLQKGGNKPQEIQDITGLRIIGYLFTDVEKICNCIDESFDVKLKKSFTEDKLGVDRIGYQSTHYICQLPHSRTKLPEFRQFEGMTLEIQVRTILQHAWAEIEHDRNYKFAGVLPAAIHRRLNLLAAALEIVDNEFDRISKEIDNYSADISQRIKTGRLKISINSTSLRQYLLERIHSSLIIENFGSANYSGKIVDELNLLKIDTLEKLDKLISNQFLDNYLTVLSSLRQNTNYMGFLRHLMMAKYPRRYFKYAWRRSFRLDKADAILLNKLGLNDAKLLSIEGLVAPPR